MHRRYLLLFVVIYCLSPVLQAWGEYPSITGKPTVISPEDLLEWPLDFPDVSPSLTEPTANRLEDFHGSLGQCDIVLTTSGNYFAALKELWPLYLNKFAAGLDIRNWYYTTSPPISSEQIRNGVVQIGNLNARCRPQLAVGNDGVMKRLINEGVAEGKPIPLIKNNGNVILVRKGNPRNIKSVWDLGRAEVTVMTPNPVETDTYDNFITTIYDVARNDANPPGTVTADSLFNSIFNADQAKAGTGRSGRSKWMAGKRIMHREIPWAIASGKADASVIFYHLALYFARTFPDKFEFVPLGGTVNDPQPLPGNKRGVLSAVRVSGPWSDKQLAARERLVDALQSPEFTGILKKNGLLRP